MTLGACRDKSLLNSQFDNNASRYERATNCFAVTSTLSEESRDFSAADSQKDRGSRKPRHTVGLSERGSREKREKKERKREKKRREKKMFSYAIISEWSATRDMGTLKKSWNSFELRNTL